MRRFETPMMRFSPILIWKDKIPRTVLEHSLYFLTFPASMSVMKKTENRVENSALVFGDAPDITPEEKLRVVGEIQKLGKLSFEVSKFAEGWMAECKEVPAIITGNTNPNPTKIEIESQIKEAIYSAFNVKFENRAESVDSPFKFDYSLPNLEARNA